MRIVPLLSLLAAVLVKADFECVVDVNLTRMWSTNGMGATALNFGVTNAGNDTLPAPWEISVENPAYLDVVQAWNLDNVTVTGGEVTGQATQTWEELAPNTDDTVDVGMVVEFESGADPTPLGVTVEGTSCILVGAVSPHTTPPPTYGNTHTPGAYGAFT